MDAVFAERERAGVAASAQQAEALSSSESEDGLADASPLAASGILAPRDGSPVPRGSPQVPGHLRMVALFARLEKLAHERDLLLGGLDS